MSLTLAACSGSSSNSNGDGPDVGLDFGTVDIGAPTCTPGQIGFSRRTADYKSWVRASYAVQNSTAKKATGVTDSNQYSLTFEGGSLELTWKGPFYTDRSPGTISDPGTGTLTLPANDAYPATTWCIVDSTVYNDEQGVQILLHGTPGDCPPPPAPGEVPPPKPAGIEIDACILPPPV